MLNNKPNTRPSNHYHRPVMILLCCLLAILLLSQFIIKNDPEQFSRKPIKSEVSIPVEQTKPEDLWTWKAAKVLNGDSLSQIFKRMNVPSSTLEKVLNSDENAKKLTKLFPGHEIRFAFDDHQELVALQYTPSKLENFSFIKNEDSGFSFEYIIKTPDTRLVYRKATLNNSLILDGKRVGISTNTIVQIASVFSGVIDFVNDPRKGDTFDALYEELYIDNEKVGDGRLLAANYSSGDTTYTAYRYEFKDGTVSYYNPEGISMRKTFLRAPLDFIRVSSEFNNHRMHPVHKKIKAHRGIDYSAPRGTPVYAAGDGLVVKAGYSPANGNFVFIRHTGEYTTKYLHFDKRLARTGQRVKQGQQIGTVGSTGYATGPHLHYEFLLNGVHRNPRDIAKLLPPALPMQTSEKPRYIEQIKPIKAEYLKRQEAFNHHAQS